MADKNLNIHLATTADPAGVNAVAMGMKEVATQAQTATLNAQQLGGTASIVGEGMDRATKSTSGFGQAALTASYFVDDMQYGIRGILNNIPGLVMGLGMGTGVAGVVSILAVGFSVASEKLGLFGGEAEKVADKTKELVKQTRDAATTAREQARSTDAQEESQRKLNDSLREADDRYTDLKRSIDAAAAARSVMIRNVESEIDAQKALDLARLESLRVGGQLTEQEAERNRLLIERGAEERKQRMEQQELANQAGDLTTQADAIRARAENRLREARRLAAGGGGLLDDEARKVAEAEAEAAKRVLDDAKAKPVPETIRAPIKYNDNDTLARRVGVGILGDVGAGNAAVETVPNPAFEQQQKAVRDAAVALQEVNRRLERDREARERVGSNLDNTEKLQKEIQRLEQETEKMRQEANLLDQQAGGLRGTAAVDARNFETETRTANVSSGNRVTQLDQRQAEQERRAAEQDARRRDAAQRALDAQQNRAAALGRRGREFAEDTPAGGREGGLLARLGQGMAALEDGATQQELDKVGALLLQFVDTAVANEKASARKLQGLYRDLQAVQKDMAKVEGAVKAGRE